MRAHSIARMGSRFLLQSRALPRRSPYSTMKALVYKSIGTVQLEERPRPTLAAATDAIIKVSKTTICGTDLHIRGGDVASCEPGRILGHEGVGVVDEVGSAVQGLRPGVRVLISCISSCARCEACRRGMYSHCATGGWILGNTIDGTQAEYVRIPYADTSLHPIPAVAAAAAAADENALVMLSDIFPTGLECGVLNGKVQPGGSVAIIGAGPVGLAALITAQLYSPSLIIVVDPDDHRLKAAAALGAHHTISPSAGGTEELVQRLTGGRGCDTVIEAVGVAATFEISQGLVAAGGVIANVGVHGTEATLHLERLWSRNISITTRLVDTVTTPMLLKMVASGKIDPSSLITHTLAFEKIEEAYRIFGAAAEHKALKILINM